MITQTAQNLSLSTYFESEFPAQCPINAYAIKNITDTQTNLTISSTTDIASVSNQGLFSTLIKNPSKDYNVYIHASNAITG